MTKMSNLQNFNDKIDPKTNFVKLPSAKWLFCTGTPPLTWFFGPGKYRVKGKPRYRRSILVLKPQNGEFELPKSTF